ncbi:MAG: S8 family serine peptidase, partial [Anaerolineaceae bacterium]|nr:S8 family serine peptidase [Anaerolineaceae bacterium]
VTLSAIAALGGQLQSVSTDADPDFDLATFLIPGDQLGAVAQLTGVYAIQPVPLDGGDRGEISNQVNVNNVDGSNIAFTGYLDWLDSVGFSGEGVIVASVDNGIDITHPDLSGQILSCTGSTCGVGVPQSFASTIGHGTHTAGIIAADGSSGVIDANGFLRGLGMAPGAKLIEQLYYPTYNYTDGMLILMTDSVRNNAVISSNSWGPSGSARGYDIDTRLVDIGVRDADPETAGNQPLTYVLSFMNGYGDPSSQGTPDEAKNIFTIGATELQEYDGTQVETINDLAYVTAYGPALDGRTIPHLVAPGCEVDSTNYPGGGYDLKCGTSMASPQVSGSVALFYEKYRLAYGGDPSPALVKAAFLPVAHDLAGNLGANDEVLGHPFDSKQGWGRLDAAAVLDPSSDLTVIYFDQEVVLDNTGETWSYTINSPAPIAYLHAMLVWTDAPGPITIDPSNPIDAWVNDLDFTLTVNSDTYFGNSFDANGLSIAISGTADGKNNTEGIFLENQPAGTYTFTVTAANIAGDGVPNFGNNTDQDFALVIYISRDAFPRQANFPIFFR